MKEDDPGDLNKSAKLKNMGTWPDSISEFKIVIAKNANPPGFFCGKKENESVVFFPHAKIRNLVSSRIQISNYWAIRPNSWRNAVSSWLFTMIYLNRCNCEAMKTKDQTNRKALPAGSPSPLSLKLRTAIAVKLFFGLFLLYFLNSCVPCYYAPMVLKFRGKRE